MNHPTFTPEQQARIPTLALLHLHRQGSAANWPATAYETVAGWCDIHSPAKAQLWRRFAYRSAEASAELEVTP
jgi:hypothetical protein